MGINKNLKYLIDPQMDTEDMLQVRVKSSVGDEKDYKSFGTQENLVRMAYFMMMGYTAKETAAEMQVSVHTVEQWRKTAEFKAVCGTLTKEITAAARTFLTAATLKATKTMLNLLDSADERIQMSAAKDILDRTGVKQDDTLHVVDQRNSHIADMSKDELALLLQKGMKELGPMLQKHNKDITFVSSEEEDADGYKQ